jgi:hypothetical protein
MNITIDNPALLFPAITLILLAYTNRFLAVAALIRNLHTRYKANENDNDLLGQIRYLQVRLQLIKHMQFLGVFAFICALMAMFLNYIESRPYALVAYASAVLLLTASLVISLVEIWQSTRALEIAMQDMKDKK